MKKYAFILSGLLSILLTSSIYGWRFHFIETVLIKEPSLTQRYTQASRNLDLMVLWLLPLISSLSFLLVAKILQLRIRRLAPILLPLLMISTMTLLAAIVWYIGFGLTYSGSGSMSDVKILSIALGTVYAVLFIWVALPLFRIKMKWKYYLMAPICGLLAKDVGYSENIAASLFILTPLVLGIIINWAFIDQGES